VLKWIVIIFALSVPAKAETLLDGPALEKAFRGATVEGEYLDGLAFTETYFPDGKIKYRDKTRGPLAGVWSVVRNRFCTFYWGMQGACFIIQLKGTNCYEIFVNPNGDLSDKDANMKRWIAQAWRTDQTKTCGDLSV
jgi:hypothetical protein